MTVGVYEIVEFPIRDILTEVAQEQGIELRSFTGDHFLPDAQKESFPYLADLSSHTPYPFGQGIEIARGNMTAFEGSNGAVSLAYFGREVERSSNFIREDGLIYIGGRRIHLFISGNGKGTMEVEDRLLEEARGKFGEDTFGGSYDKNPRGKYGFMQRAGDPSLPGIRSSLDHLLQGQ